MERALEVFTSSGSRYSVFMGGSEVEFLDLAWAGSWRQAVVMGDSNTFPLYGLPLVEELQRRGVAVLPLDFPAGEAHKSRETKARLEDAMLAAGVERGACVVGVGGGIVLDVAGFVAATYMRGMASVGVATTLLAQVDASVGGKTGVNTSAGKNLIGAFHQPHAVWCHTRALQTLPREELGNGWAEAIKHAVIADACLFQSIEEWAADSSRPFPEPLLRQCLEIKSAVVGRDERETGERQILNFGHTVGHALEKVTHHAIPHGKAVAVGMAVEAAVAQVLCGFPAADARRLNGLLAHLGLVAATGISFRELAPYFRMDKKSRHGEICCALPRFLGGMESAGGRFALDVPLPLLEQAWSAYENELGSSKDGKEECRGTLS